MNEIALKQVQAAWPKAPHEIRDEVELYARESGRTGSIHWIPGGGWFVRLELRSNDPRMRLYQEGRAEQPPHEDVWLHVAKQDFDRNVHPAIRGHEPWQRGRENHPFVPLDIYQMGASGVRTFLEAGNTWSGRGVFGSHEEALRKSEAANEATKEKRREDAEFAAGKRAKERRRTLLKIPFLRVGARLTSGETHHDNPTREHDHAHRTDA